MDKTRCCNCGKDVQQEYGNLTKKASPNTESWISIPWAFMVGGLICTLGQGLINLWEYMGLSEEMAPTAASGDVGAVKRADNRVECI